MINPKGYGSIPAYVNFIRENFKKIEFPFLNRFYTFNYKFNLDYPWEELRFYDLMPLSYMFAYEETPKTAKDGVQGYVIGLNFHHIPLSARVLWWHRLQKFSKRVDSIIPYIDFYNKNVYKIPKLFYPMVYKILPKTKLAIRKYRLDRIFDLRAVNLSLMTEVYKFWSTTWLDVTIKDIQKRYQDFKL